MMPLYWKTLGDSDRHLVLLHGWGLNAGVWHDISVRLSAQFTLHLVDLPGYGRSQGFGPLTLPQMADALLAQAPARAVWLGWSLGGLVASQLALAHPERVDGLITVASSPCFSAGDDWPGIRPATLGQFQQQLSEDFQRTVERFLALQTLGTESARQDARRLKEVVLEQPVPSVAVLNGGLSILRSADLREALSQLTLPHLRLYGALDGLVPRAIVPQLDARWPVSRSHLFSKAAHAPFISHPDAFCEQVSGFVNQIYAVGVN